MIPFRLPKSAIKPLLIASLSLVVAGGFALAVVPTAAPLSTTVRPHSPSPSSSPKASATPATAITTPASVPAVAGVSTIAPTPTPRPAAALPAAASCPDDTGAIVHLTIKYPGVSTTCNVHISANPCSLLYQAQSEGMITTLTIYDSPEYMAKHNDSAYLYDLNGYKDNWTYTAQDPTGKPLQAPGCPYPVLQSGDSVTWKFGG